MSYFDILQNNKDYFVSKYGGNWYNKEYDRADINSRAIGDTQTVRQFNNISRSYDTLAQKYGYDVANNVYNQFYNNAVNSVNRDNDIYGAIKDDYQAGQFKTQFQYADTDEDRVRQATGLVPSSFNINEALKDYVPEGYVIPDNLKPEQLEHLMNDIQKQQSTMNMSRDAYALGNVSQKAVQTQRAIEDVKDFYAGQRAELDVANQNTAPSSIPENYNDLIQFNQQAHEGWQPDDEHIEKGVFDYNKQMAEINEAEKKEIEQVPKYIEEHSRITRLENINDPQFEEKAREYTLPSTSEQRSEKKPLVEMTEMELRMNPHKNRFHNLDGMTQDQLKIYAYYAATDTKLADEYAKAIERQTSAALVQEQQSNMEKVGETTVGKALLAATSVPVKMLSGVAHLGAGLDLMAGDSELPDNPNAWYTAPASFVSQARDMATKDMSETGKFLTHTGLSIADFAAAYLATGGAGGIATAGGKAATTGLMASEAAGMTTYDVLQRGGTKGEAWLTGTVTGGVEAATELISIGALDDAIKSIRALKGAGAAKTEMAKQFVKNSLIQAGTEGGEEFISEITGNIVDIAINGDNSSYEKYVNELIAQGVPEAEARQQAGFKFFGKDAALAFVGGALSGGVMGSGVQVSQMIKSPQDIQAAEALLNDIDAKIAENPSEGVTKELTELKETVQTALDTAQQGDTRALSQEGTKPTEQTFDTHRSAITLVKAYQGTEYGAMLNDDIKQGKADYHVESAVPDFEQALQSVESGKVRTDNYDAVETNGEIKKYNKQDVVNLLALLDKAVQDGNTEEQNQITAAIYDAGLQLGRGVQAFSLLKKSSPNVHLETMMREIQKFNAEGRKKFKDKWTDVAMTADEQQSVLDAKSFEERTDIYQKFVDRVHDDLPSTFWQKLDQIRKTGMLFNVKTQLRNILGNTAQMSANAAARKIEAGLQKFLPKDQRTQVFKIKSEYKKLVDGEWQKAKDAYSNYGRYNIEAKLGQGYQNAFKNKKLGKLINNITNLTGKALDIGDVVFGKHHYETALASFLQARNMTEVTPEAREYAMLRALEATFRAESKLATAINHLIKKGGVGGKAMSVVMPFVKTPINIAKQAFDYSPLGLGKSATIDLVKVKKGDMSATQWIHNISKGLTGTGIAVLGFLLAKGIIPGVGITGAPPENEKEYELLKQQGWKPYSLKIGDTYFPVTWAQPFATPMMMGVTIADASDEELEFKDVLDVTSVLFDSIAEVSPLSGVQDALTYNDSVGDIALDVGGDLASQMVPAMGKQIGNIIDPNVYDLYSGGVIENTKNMAVKGIPGLDAGLEALGIDTDVAQKVDAWGQPVTQSDNILERTALNTLSPSYFSTETEDPVNQEIFKLHEKTGNNSVFPRVVNKNDFKGIELTNKELQGLQEGIGQLSKKVVESYINSADYKKDNEETKTKTISDLYADVVALYKEAKKKGAEIRTILPQAKRYAEEHGGVMDVKMLSNPGIPEELFDLYKETGDDLFLLDDTTFSRKGQEFDYPVGWGEGVIEELERTRENPDFDFLSPAEQADEIEEDILAAKKKIEDEVISETPYDYLEKLQKGVTKFDIKEVIGWDAFDIESDVISALDELDITPKNPQSINGVEISEAQKKELAEFTYDLLDDLDSKTKFTVEDTIDTAYDMWKAYQIPGWDTYDFDDVIIDKLTKMGVKPINAQRLNGKDMTGAQKQSLADYTYRRLKESAWKSTDEAKEIISKARKEWEKMQ